MFLGLNESNWSSGLPCIQFLGSWPHIRLQTPQYTPSLGRCSSCSPLLPCTPPPLPFPPDFGGRAEEGRSHCSLCLFPLLHLLPSGLYFSSWHSCLSQAAFNLQSLLPPTTHTHTHTHTLRPDQFSSVTQLRLTLCNSMECSTLGFPVHHQLPELTQTHVHQVDDAIQPSHRLSSPSPPAFNFPLTFTAQCKF